MEKGSNTLYNLKLQLSISLSRINAHKTHGSFSTMFPLKSHTKTSTFVQYSLLASVTTHTLLQESPPLQQHNYQSIECNRSPPKPPLILLLHKATPH